MQSEERGATLVEVFGVLAILAVVGASVWTLVNSAWNRYRLSQTLSQLQTLQKGITRMYASAGKYDDLASDAIRKLLENNIPPADMKAGDNALRHAMGGAVEVKNVQYENVAEFGSASDSFTITFKDFKNKKACADLAAYSWTGNDFANIVSVKVKDTKYVWPSYAELSTDKTLPITQADAMSLCEGIPLDITWEFR
ncbi:MAG: hypothetical protein IJ660_05075 [Alphaproteobacteria bacterium]|nr:hypothetical protein [Alphaproteobacteria bacterium]